MNIAEMTVQVLEEAGVDLLVGVPGSVTEALNNALLGSRIKIVVASHEQGAVLIAGEYSRATGRPVAVFCTSGPANGNLLAGISFSMYEGLPIIALGGHTALSAQGKWAMQESFVGPLQVDWVSAFASTTKYSSMMLRENAELVLKTALTEATTGIPGPVYVACPADVMRQEAAPPQAVQAKLSTELEAIDRRQIGHIASRLLASSNPLIIAGYGVRQQGAAADLLRLAETLDVPFATTPYAKAVLPEDHPLSLGVYGFGGQGMAKEYVFDWMSSDDCLLVVGSRLGELASYGWDERLREPFMIRLDQVPMPSLIFPGDLYLSGNLAAMVRSTADLAADMGVRESALGSAERVRSIRRRCQLLQSTREPTRDGYDPAEMIRDVQQAMAAFDGVDYLCDIGSVMAWCLEFLRPRASDSFTLPLSSVGMGQSVAGVLGRKLADPQRPAVAFVGDGGFLMNGLEVLTAVRYGLDPIWVVLNNGGYAMVRDCRKLFPEPIPEVIPSDKAEASFAQVAESLGAVGVRIERPGELTPDLMRELVSARRPVVLDVVVDRSIVAPGLRERIAMIQAAQGGAASACPVSAGSNEGPALSQAADA